MIVFHDWMESSINLRTKIVLEECPIILLDCYKVEKDGREVSYVELEKMSLKDLMQCKVSLLGKGLDFKETEPEHRQFFEEYKIGIPYSCRWYAFGLVETYEHKLEDHAIGTLESMYQLAVSLLQGGY